MTPHHTDNSKTLTKSMRSSYHNRREILVAQETPGLRGLDRFSSQPKLAANHGAGRKGGIVNSY